MPGARCLVARYSSLQAAWRHEHWRENTRRQGTGTGEPETESRKIACAQAHASWAPVNVDCRYIQLPRYFGLLTLLPMGSSMLAPIPAGFAYADMTGNVVAVADGEA